MFHLANIKISILSKQIPIPRAVDEQLRQRSSTTSGMNSPILNITQAIRDPSQSTLSSPLVEKRDLQFPNVVNQGQQLKDPKIGDIKENSKSPSSSVQSPTSNTQQTLVPPGGQSAAQPADQPVRKVSRFFVEKVSEQSGQQQSQQQELSQQPLQMAQTPKSIPGKWMFDSLMESI